MQVREEIVTEWLVAWGAGDREAAEQVLPRVYGELRRIALVRLRGEREGHTLNPTALVHEAYLRLAELERIQWRSRAHFFNMAARTMRRVLIDHARAAGSAKRGGERQRTELDPETPGVSSPGVEGLVLDEALARLAAFDPEGAAVIELHALADLSVAETAAVLELSTATVVRRFRAAKAWLYRELYPEAGVGR